MSTDKILLETLAEIAPRRATEIRLQPWVNARILQPLSLAELRAKLKALERKGWVAAITPDLSDEEWFIADAGRAALAAAQ